MNYLNKLERKLGKYAIPNLAMWLVVGYGIGYLLYLITPLNIVYDALVLDPYKICHGQIWRLLTWIITPPQKGNIFFGIIMMFIYYQLGRTLEGNWGTFKFNAYIFGGVFFTDIGAMLTYLVYYLMSDNGRMSQSFMVQALSYGFTDVPEFIGYVIGTCVSTYYINLGIFLAFALCYPEMTVLFMFIIPIKMKWMAVVYGVLMLYSLVVNPWPARVVMIMSMVNFFIFFFSIQSYRSVIPMPKTKTQREFRQSTEQPRMRRERAYEDGNTLYKHRCVECGRTDITNPELEFRFCSKCNGSYEYCNDHLYTHLHK